MFLPIYVFTIAFFWYSIEFCYIFHPIFVLRLHIFHISTFCMAWSWKILPILAFNISKKQIIFYFPESIQ